MSNTCKASARGHTLIEQLIAVAVLAVLAGAGLPSLRGWIDQRAVQVRAESLRSALRLARGVALNRQTQVSLCARRSGPPDAPDACALAGKDWGAGWVAFVDQGVRGEVDEGERILHVALPTRDIGRVVATVRYVTFQGTGISLNAAARFTFLPASASADALTDPRDLLVCVNKPGRARILDADVC